MEHVRAYHCSHRRHRKIGRPCFTGKRLVAYVWDFLKARPEERFQKATTEQALNIAERLHRQGLFAALKAARNEKPLRDNLKYKYRVAPAEEVKALPGMA